MRMLTPILLVLMWTAFASYSMPRKYEDYINYHLLTAQLLESTTGVPTSIQFAQAIIESGAGRSGIAKGANNHFGIRCGDNWKGLRYYTKSGCWRKYDTVKQGFLDHACYMNNYYPNAVGKNWQYWVNNCKGYGEAGYFKKLGRIIKRYKLYKYDL